MVAACISYKSNWGVLGNSVASLLGSIVGTTVTSREVKSWTRFVMRHLAAQPNIMGHEHRFAFDQNMITVKLPRLAHVNRGEGYDEIASVRVRSAAMPRVMRSHA